VDVEIVEPCIEKQGFSLAIVLVELPHASGRVNHSASWSLLPDQGDFLRNCGRQVSEEELYVDRLVSAVLRLHTSHRTKHGGS